MRLKNGPEETLPMTSWTNAVRNMCFDCSGWNWNEVRLCERTTCFLYGLRLGKNPFRKKRELTDEQKQKQAENLKKARSEKHEKRGDTPSE